MKIVVIGKSRHETIERLRKDGHEAVGISWISFARPTSKAPDDPGYAGRALREFLKKSAIVLRDIWLGRLQYYPGRHAADDRGWGSNEDDVR